MEPVLTFSKVRDVTSPRRANKTDAGIDFFVPNKSDGFINDLKLKNPGMGFYFGDKDLGDIIINPNCGILIPSGIKVNVPEDYALIAFNKSGICTKKKVMVGACVIDNGYCGEVHIHLQNISNVSQSLSFGEKVVQFILIPINCCLPEEVPFEKLYPKATERGEGGFGSTDSKIKATSNIDYGTANKAKGTKDDLVVPDPL